MAVKTLDELFEHELKDIYYAEHRLVEALTELASETKVREIKQAYTSHKKETQGQIKRLQKVFKMFGVVPEVEKCPGIEGLLKEKHNFTKKEKPSQEILDYFNLCAAQKAERYEITAYESLIEIAQQLGMDDAVELLAETLQEEEAALEKAQTLAQQCDMSSMMSEEDEEEGSTSRSSSKRSSSKRSSSKRTASKKKSSKKSSSHSSHGAATKKTARNTSSKKAAPRSGARRTGSRAATGSKAGSAANTAGASGPAANTGDYPQQMEQLMEQTDPATRI
jgi:ferritin-like metal-binding protein YciE